MIIKETPWEKRNLEVQSSIEFYIEQNEEWKDIHDELTKHKESYQVMHIAAGNANVLLNAPTIGFSPIEMNIQLGRKLDQVELPAIYKRFEPYISCDIASIKEKEIILEIIKEASMFSTDKVAMDPFFGKSYAGRRYAYWTQDVIDKGALLLCMKYKDQIAAFDVYIEKNKECEAFLGGTIPKFQSSGLGFIAVYLITKYAKEKNMKKITTGVSSNNLPILRIHEMFGYSVDSMSYCMIKHL